MNPDGAPRGRPRRVRRALLLAAAVVVGLPVAAIATALLYLAISDLDEHRERVERIASRALGRELRIAGAFEVDVGLTTRVLAEDVTLANPVWATVPAMVEVGRLEGSIELLPLLSRTVRLPDVVVSGARVSLESDGAGGGNWEFDLPRRRPRVSPGRPWGVETGSVSLRDVEVAVLVPAADAPRRLDLDSVEIASDAAGLLSVALAGRLDGAPVEVLGRTGPLSGWMRAGAVEIDLAGRLDDTAVDIRASATNLARLEGVAGRATLRGPDLARAVDLLRLSRVGEGPFEVEATVRPRDGGSDVALDAALDRVAVSLAGTLDSLRAPRAVEADFRASGPDLAEVGALVGFGRLPADPFRVEGRVSWAGFPVRLEGVEVEIGANRVAIDGTLGEPPAAVGTDVRIDGSGPDVSHLAALAGVELPAVPFRVAGRIVRVDDGLRFERFEARIGDDRVSVGGTLGDPPDHRGTALSVRARVSDPTAYETLAGVPLPALPIEVDGRVRGDGAVLRLEDLLVAAGGNAARVRGTVRTAERWAGTDLEIEAEGPGLEWLSPWLGERAASLPAGPYRVAGGVMVERNGWRVREVVARLGEVEATVDGRLAASSRLEGSDVRVRASGPDLAALGPMVGRDDLPREPFSVAGRALVGADRTEVAGLEARVGRWTAHGGGAVGHGRRLDGTTFEIVAAGPLAALSGLAGRDLPEVDATIEGSIAWSGEAVVAAPVAISIGGLRATIDGAVRPSGELEGTEVVLAIEGPDLGEVGRWVADAGLAELPALPADGYRVSGRLEIEADGYRVGGLEARVGDASARIDGRLGRQPGRIGTDLAIAADGADLAPFAALLGVEVPPGPFRVRGRVGRDAVGLRLEGLEADLGNVRVEADGILGETPGLRGSDLDFRASGPDLSTIADFVRRDDLPALPFAVEGHVLGDPSGFELQRFSATLGSSDVAGRFRLDRSGRPRIEGRFVTRRIELAELLPPPRPVEAGDERATPGAETPADRRPEYRIPRDPLDLRFLQGYDADVSWEIREVSSTWGVFSRLDLGARLEDGALRVGPFTGTGRLGGRLEGSVEIDPHPDGIAARARIVVAGARLDMSSVDDDPEEWPGLDVDLAFEATGGSLHGLATAAEGRALVVIGEGAVDSSLVDRVAADFIRTLLQALNPFRKAHPSSHLECAVIAVDVGEGVARIEPIAVRTDKLTVVGEGRIDLGPETLDLTWAVKPRKGIGVSASTLSNPYLKLGGTLARPRLEVKPMQATVSTGAAVATGGLSILGRGLWDRVTAERKVCERAIARAGKAASRAEDERPDGSDR